MSVLDIETLGFGVSKETFDPPSFPVKTQGTCRGRDICSHYNQFVFDPFPFKPQKILLCPSHAAEPAFPSSIALFAKE